MPAAEWAHHLSLGLGWMAPGQASAFVGRAQAASILAQDNGLLRVTFAPETVDVPLGFRPDPSAAAPPRASSQGDAFADWLLRVAAQTGLARPAILTQVAERQARMGGLLSAFAALLWIAADNGLDVAAAAGSINE